MRERLGRIGGLDPGPRGVGGGQQDVEALHGTASTDRGGGRSQVDADDHAGQITRQRRQSVKVAGRVDDGEERDADEGAHVVDGESAPE